MNCEADFQLWIDKYWNLCFALIVTLTFEWVFKIVWITTTVFVRQSEVTALQKEHPCIYLESFL